jgi:adenylylsulfate kinase
MVKVFWLFGRSAAGKSTLAQRLHQDLVNRGVPTFYLDGDEMRANLCADLGYTAEARLENHRRIAAVAELAAAQGFNVVASTIAPEYAHRDVVQNMLGAKLVWFHIHAPLEVCIQRDPKGLYRRAKAGRLKQLLDFPFDVPRPQEQQNYIDTVAQNIDDCHQSILKVVLSHLMADVTPMELQTHSHRDG